MNKLTYIFVIIGVLYSTGCSIEEKVPIEKHFWVPNSFSPNGDGVNETFLIYPISGTAIDEFHLKIFTSQLQEIYRSDNFPDFYVEGWNGKNAGGTEMPAGYYEYQVIYTAAEDSINFHPYVTASTINLLR